MEKALKILAIVAAVTTAVVEVLQNSKEPKA